MCLMLWVYFGAELEDRNLVPAGTAVLGEIGYEEWAERSALRIAP